MWGWLAAIVKGFAQAFFGWLREKERDRLLLSETKERLAREDAEQKAKAHAKVAEIRDRDLGPDPGRRVRDVEKRLDD